MVVDVHIDIAAIVAAARMSAATAAATAALIATAGMSATATRAAALSSRRGAGDSHGRTERQNQNLFHSHFSSHDGWIAPSGKVLLGLQPAGENRALAKRALGRRRHESFSLKCYPATIAVVNAGRTGLLSARLTAE